MAAAAWGLAVAISVAMVAATAAEPGAWCGGATPEYNATFCPSDSSTCCAYPWSPNGYGCCPFANGVCCPGSYTCCPAGTVCHNLVNNSWSTVSECISSQASVPGKQICKIGVMRPFDSQRKSLMVIGDSVSIGYTPYIASALNAAVDVQHSPDSGDGGACESAYGLDCLEFFLTSSSGQALAPDAIMFNFGLHNLLTPGQSAVPGQSDFWTNYIQPLATITSRLKALNTPLLFAITSPMLCNTSQDDIVLLLNTQAAALMQQEGIPTVNLHDAITNKCGPVPQASCFGETGCWCPHCPPGYEWLANSTIVPAIKSVMGL